MNKIIAILITALLLVGGGAYVKTHKQDSDKKPTQATSTAETSYKQETFATESVGQKTEREDEDSDENGVDDNEGRTSASKETIKPTTKPATQTGAKHSPLRKLGRIITVQVATQLFQVVYMI